MARERERGRNGEWIGDDLGTCQRVTGERRTLSRLAGTRMT